MNLHRGKDIVGEADVLVIYGDRLIIVQAKAKKLTIAARKTLEDFFHAHNCRRAQLIEGRLESIRCAVSLTDDPGIVAPHRLHALMLVAQLRTVLAAIDVFDKEIAAVARKMPDFDLFDSLPGAGPHLTPRLLAAFGEQRDRFKAKSFWAGAYYRQQRAKGSSYQAAVRALAFKWIRILYRCWQTGARYDESSYLNALRKRGLPLLGNLALPR